MQTHRLFLQQYKKTCGIHMKTGLGIQQRLKRCYTKLLHSKKKQSAFYQTMLKRTEWVINFVQCQIKVLSITTVLQRSQINRTFFSCNHVNGE